MSAKFSVVWSNNASFKRPMSKHTFRLRDLGLPQYRDVTVHIDQVTILFRPVSGTGAIDPSEYVPPDNANLPWHVETDQLMVRCSPGVRYPLYVGDDPKITKTSNIPYREDVGTDREHVQRVCTYSCALACTPNQVNDESYWCRTYRPVRDLPVVRDTSHLTELTLELFFPTLLGDSQMAGTFVPDYRIHKVFCEFSLHW